MKRQTHLYTDEQTFWHCTGVQASHMQVGGWVEPPAGSYGADTPGSKRRLLNLVRASHFDDCILVTSSPAASREALLRVHPAGYIDEFKRVSDAGGGELGPYAPFSKGGFEIASSRQALQLLLSTVFFLVNAITVMLCAAPPATTASLTSPWGSACWLTSPSLSKLGKPYMGSSGSLLLIGTFIMATVPRVFSMIVVMY